MEEKKEDNSNENEKGKLIKKNINLKTIIIYGSMVLVSFIIWFVFNEKIKEDTKSNIWVVLLTTLIVNGIIGLINTLVLEKEKEKVLDASIARVRTVFLKEHYIYESISNSLKRGFEYCNNKVKTLRVYAVSTTMILPFVEEKKDNIHIEKCNLMVRGYSENMSKDEVESDNEIKNNIRRWEALKPECIKELTYIRYNNYSLNYYCIFDNKFITFGQYLVDDEKNVQKVDPLQPFSITDKTEVGQQIIKISIDQFDSYFNSEKKKRINFNEFASRYDNFRKADKELVNILIKECGIAKKANILDFGCGTGNYIKEFQELGFKNIFGLDASEEMRKKSSGKTHVKIYEQFNEVNELFDFILIIDVMHFIKNINLLAKKLYSKCENNAMVAIVTQSHQQIKNRRYGDFFPSTIEIDLERYHDIDALIDGFESAGFSLQKNIPYKENTIRYFDFSFLNNVRNKCFSMFELIDEKEFNNGIKKFEEALKGNNGKIEESYAGKTILLFSKDDDTLSRIHNVA